MPPPEAKGNMLASYFNVLGSFYFLFTRSLLSVDLRKKLPSMKH
jgi:hypothetical protein